MTVVNQVLFRVATCAIKKPGYERSWSVSFFGSWSVKAWKSVCETPSWATIRYCVAAPVGAEEVEELEEVEDLEEVLVVVVSVPVGSPPPPPPPPPPGGPPGGPGGGGGIGGNNGGRSKGNTGTACSQLIVSAQTFENQNIPSTIPSSPTMTTMAFPSRVIVLVPGGAPDSVVNSSYMVH